MRHFIIVLLFCIPSIGLMSQSTVSYSGKIAIRGVNYWGQGKFAFKIINESGNVIWQNGSSSSKTISVEVKNGYYTVLLGGQGMNPLPPDLFLKYQNPRLQVWFDQGDGSGLKRLLPDNPISSSPHALSAELARNAIIANSVISGSVTKDMLSSELLTELSSGGSKSVNSSNASIEGGVVVALPLSESPPKSATLYSIGPYNGSVGKSNLGKIITEEFKNKVLPRGGSFTKLVVTDFIRDDKLYFVVSAFKSYSTYEYYYGKTIRIYDPSSQSWDEIIDWKGGPDKWIKSAYYLGVIYFIVEDNSGGKSLHSYNMNTQMWESLPNPPFKKKFVETGGFLCAYKGSIFYFGGYKLDGGEAFRYDIYKREWTDIPFNGKILSGVVREGKAYLNQRSSMVVTAETKDLTIVYNLNDLTMENIKYPGNNVSTFFFLNDKLHHHKSVYDELRNTWFPSNLPLFVNGRENIFEFDTTLYGYIGYGSGENLYSLSIEKINQGSFDLYITPSSISSGGGSGSGGVPENGSITKNMLNSDLLNELSNPTITLNQLPQEVRDDLNKSITITRSMLPQDVREDLNRTITRNMLPADVLTDLNASVGLNRLSSEVRSKLDQNTSVANGSITASKIANDSINTNHLSENILKYLRPIITSQPQSIDLFMETNMSFSVGVDGRYLSYQWKNNGVDIPGETNSTIHIIDANATLHDGNYTISVTNDFGSVESTPFELKVVADPVLNGLEGWWKFDSNDTSIAVDSSGNNKHGTLSGSPSRTTGKINGAMSFDGVDDKLTVQHQFFADRSFSILFWFKDVNDFTYFFHQGGGSNGGGRKEFVFRFLPSTNKLTTSFYYDDLNSNYIKETSWTHLGLTYEKSATTRKLYINGNMIMSDTDQEHYYGNSEFRLGRMNYAYATVTFDDVRVYNRPISASEVDSIFKLGN